MERLSWADIEGRYLDEWVLIADPEVDEAMNMVSGVVVAHDHDRAAVDAAAEEIRLRSSALFYIGEPEPGLVFVL